MLVAARGFEPPTKGLWGGFIDCWRNRG